MSNRPTNPGAPQPGSPSGTTNRPAKPLPKLTRQPSQPDGTPRKARLAEGLDGIIREQPLRKQPEQPEPEDLNGIMREQLDGIARKQLVERVSGIVRRMRFQTAKANPRASTPAPTPPQVNRPQSQSRKTTANHTPTISPSRPRRSSD